jgi:hypothetical protein
MAMVHRLEFFLLGINFMHDIKKRPIWYTIMFVISRDLGLKLLNHLNNPYISH